MPTTFKVLGQSKPTSATLTDCYTVPALTQATVSSIVVCNQAAAQTSFRISVAVAGAADTASQYIYYNVVVPGNNSFVATIGLSLGAGDVVRVYNALATCSFSIYGCEVS